MREKELGKNYLLETYLNGLHEAEDRDVTTGKSTANTASNSRVTQSNLYNMLLVLLIYGG